MKLSPVERAMLREMGVAWPDPLQPPTAGQASAWEPELGWGALQSAVAACRRCGLCETRRNTVFGAGHPRAHWMVVGEAPGEQEDRLGQPFVG
ncbi:MAG: uracil-DNA glycosylase, partial [Betaproteobacteria bacterium]